MTNSIYTLRALGAMLLMLSFNSMIHAQDDLPTGEVEVVKNYKARIIDNAKVQISPTLPEASATSNPEYDYQITSSPVSVSYGTPTIRPLGFPSERNPESHKGYLKAGYGWPSSPYAELGYQLDLGNSKSRRRGSRGRGRSKSAQGQPYVGLSLLHHQADNTDNVTNQRFANTNGKLYFGLPTSSGFGLQGDVGYQIRDEYFYGQQQDSVFYPDLSEDDARRRFKMWSASAKIFNTVSNDLEINYTGSLKFYNLSDQFGFGVVSPLPVLTDASNTESGLAIDLQADKSLSEKHRVGIDLQSEIHSYEADYSLDDSTRSVSSDLNNFFLRPYVDLHFDNFRVDLGAQLATSDGEFYFFPDVELSAQISGDKVIAFVGADGGLRKNTFRTLSEYNPYIGPALDSGLFNTVERQYYGGVKGKLDRIQYMGRIGFSQVDNLPLYFADHGFGFFQTQSDTGTVVSIETSLRSPITPNVSAHADLNYNIYNLDSNEEPWHLPTWEANMGLTFTSPDDKLRVRGEIFLENAIPYLDNEGNSQTLQTLFDVNVGGEYFFAENIGAFLQLNNLANNERQRWLGYPQMGINVLGGIVARF